MQDVPPQAGKVVIVTGANSGIGFEAAKMLAAKGATVVLACRSTEKANDAAERIRQTLATANLLPMQLDVSALASIRQFAKRLTQQFGHLDVLINNAGVMALPYAKTVDGFELQFGTNHLGPFALTGLLLPLLEKARAPRVVAVSSTMHRVGAIRLDDLQHEKGYRKWPAYGASKLANLLFTFELERRLRAGNQKTIAVACHPGYANTNLVHVGPAMTKSWFFSRLFTLGAWVASQSSEQGAWPTVYAATEPSVKGGDYVGPDGWFELRGEPTLVRSNKASRNEALASALWAESERLTQVTYPLPR